MARLMNRFVPSGVPVQHETETHLALMRHCRDWIDVYLF